MCLDCQEGRYERGEERRRSGVEKEMGKVVGDRERVKERMEKKIA